ncbi:hypothetical protein [Sphingomonas gei]|uniref:hypothetical protein n=1 Tax=Sphingomonas gei TaxID=1395960 RepID=UPI0019D2F331|nr:hypothetical protein [Sphingomonas gei]
MALPVVFLGACALQPEYRRPALDVPGSWTNGPGGSPPSQATVPMGGADRWSQLDDPAIDHLVSAGLSDNPTLAEAAARVDQARALVTVREAGKVPAVGIEGGGTRTRDRFDPSGGPSHQTSAILPGSPARAGMYANGAIAVGESRALVVPAECVVIRDGRSYVMLLSTPGKRSDVALRAVTTGGRKDDQVEIMPEGDAEIGEDISAGFLTALAAGVLCIYCVLVLLFRDSSSLSPFFRPRRSLSAAPSLRCF